jgi:hypothetical protein
MTLDHLQGDGPVRLEPDSDRVTYLDIVYDTHPIRVLAGNKYEL